MKWMETKSVEEINFQHILERKGFSTTEANNVLISLRRGATFIANLWKDVEDICWKDLISLKIGVKTEISPLITVY